MSIEAAAAIRTAAVERYRVEHLAFRQEAQERLAADEGFGGSFMTDAEIEAEAVEEAERFWRDGLSNEDRRVVDAARLW